MSASSSVPPTPVEASTATSPSDASDFIIAIAAQERRVLELREELARVEADLASLKKQWTAREPYDKRRGSHEADSRRRAAAPGTLDDDAATASRRSFELNRRKLLLQNQGQSTPAQSRRRVLRGRRASCLCSPRRGRMPSLASTRTTARDRRTGRRPSRLVGRRQGARRGSRAPPRTRRACLRLSKTLSWGSGHSSRTFGRSRSATSPSGAGARRSRSSSSTGARQAVGCPETEND